MVRARVKSVRKILGALLLLAGAALAADYAWKVWLGRNQLAPYGLTYELRYGEHQDFQTMAFHWDPRHRTHPPLTTGPLVTDDDLYLRFQKGPGEDAPRLIVRSEVYPSHQAVFRLNFTDPGKPEIELLENHGMGVAYPPPWSDYYRRDEATGGLTPASQ